MVILNILYLISSNASTNRRDKSIYYARIVITMIIGSFILNLNSYYYEIMENQIGLYSGLYHITINTHLFHLFLFIIVGIIMQLNAFYPRKLHTKNLNYTMFVPKLIYNNSLIFNKMAEPFRIIEYPLIVLFVLIGGIFLISSSDLISIFLSIELQSYGLYILCAVYRNSEKSISGALMYFLLGGLSSCFILLSSALLYANSGNTNFDGLYIINNIYNTAHDVINLTMYDSHYINLCLIILSVGFLFKISAAPFHFWSPDVYDAIPTIVTTLVAVFAKISILVLLLEITYNATKFLNLNVDIIKENLVNINDASLIYNNNYWTSALMISSLLSLIIGAVLGLTQFRIKRLYAYSTISHLGFMLLAISVTSIESLQSFIFYLIQYSITNLNAFLLLIIIGYSLYTYVDTESIEKNYVDRSNSPIQYVNQLKGYFYINPIIAISLTLTLFSFVGIPPLVGFFGKQMVLSSALDNGYTFIVLVGIITSVISAYYYLAIIKKIFFEKNDFKLNPIIDNIEIKALYEDKKKDIRLNSSDIKLTSSLSFSTSVLTIIIVLFIINPEEWLNMTNILSTIGYNSY